MNYLRSIRLKDQPEAWDTCSYLNSMPLVEYLANAEGLAFTKPVTFFVGENGTGKSTLLEAIASVDYEDTESYRITKEFLDDPQRMVHYLLDSK